MKVTRKMIQPELRMRGFLLDFLNTRSSEKRYLKSLKRTRWLTTALKGRKAKGLHMEEVWIRREDGTRLRLCIYRSKKKTHAAVPGILWLHGGGYAQGIPELSSPTYRRLLKARPSIVIAPDYRLSTEAPYPAALEDAYRALLWMKEHAKELGIRSDQLMVGGESAGGGLTAALTLYARDKGEVNIAFQMPLYPMIDDRGITESFRENDAPIWNAKTNTWAWKLYLGELYGKEVPAYAAPSRATDHHHLPPALTFVGDVEPFRDEVRIYTDNLIRSGVPVTFRLFKGCYHGFDIIHPRADISREAIRFFIDGFKNAVDHYTAKQPGEKNPG